MISRTFGAPLGGTICAGQYDFESLAAMLIVPPNTGGGGGNCFPSIVVVAAGDPGGGALASSAAKALPSKLSRPDAARNPKVAPATSTAPNCTRDRRSIMSPHGAGDEVNRWQLRSAGAKFARCRGGRHRPLASTARTQSGAI